MNAQRSLYRLLVLAVVAGACTDSLVPSPTPQVVVTPVSGVKQGPPDHALEMREKLRGKPDDEFIADVARANNVVTIGFKPNGQARGVDNRGRSLVAESNRRQHVNTVRGLSRRFIYEFQHIPAVAVQLPTPQAAASLRRLPWVDYVQPNSQDWSTDDGPAPNCNLSINEIQTTPAHATQVEADRVWGYHTGSNGAVLVLDDGLDLMAGGGSAVEELPFWYQYTLPGQVPGQDDGRHGTLVSSIISSRDNAIGTIGIAPGSYLHVGQIVANGVSLSWNSAAAQIIDQAVSYTKVISISYSSKETGVPAGFTSLLDAIRNAYNQRGMLIVASTGNGENPNIKSFPAAWAEVVGVGGANASNQWKHNNYAAGNVEIAAPSEDVIVLCRGAAALGRAGGTSFSTPIVAGAAMLVWDKFPSISNDSVRARLRNYATPMASQLKSGAGMLNIYKSLWPPPVPPPQFTATLYGPGWIAPYETYQFTLSLANGTPPYTYQWYIDDQPYETASELYASFGPSSTHYIYAEVWDANNAHATSQVHTVNVSSGQCPPEVIQCGETLRALKPSAGRLAPKTAAAKPKVPR